MLVHLAARVMLMAGEGVNISDAIAWVVRRIDRNLKNYYRSALARLVWEALT